MTRRITWRQVALGPSMTLIVGALVMAYSVLQLDYIVRLHVIALIALAWPVVPATAVFVVVTGAIIRLAGGTEREMVLGCLLALGTIEAATFCIIAGLLWF